MKTTSFVLLLMLSILNSCKNDELNAFRVGVDVQSSFDQDNVQILIDGREKINKPLQTNHLLGVCLGDGQFHTTINEGSHKLKVIVNNSITKTETFSLHNDLYVGINYDPQTNEISFVYSDYPFGYD